MSNHFPVGKLPPDVLARLLATYVPGAADVVVGAALGEDAAALRLPANPDDQHCLVVASDPVTFATDAIGHYVVHINANDVATSGARPRWFVATLLVPPGSGGDEVEAAFAGIAAACGELDIVWCGGHTEVTAGLDRPLAVGTMLGIVPRSRLLRTGDARPGDRILCTKTVPLEATALIAREWPEWTGSRLGEQARARCARLLFEPGVSVVAEGLAAADAGATALHDPTEGGIMTGLAELATAAGVGLEIDLDSIPVDADGGELCRAAGIDPLGALASGTMLVTAPRDRVNAVEEAIAGVGVACVSVGLVTPADDGLVAMSGGRRRPFPRYEVDEIARLYDGGGPPLPSPGD